MKRHLVPILALATGITLATQATADDADYPQGRPFQAIESDLQQVKDDIADLSSDTADLQADVTMIKSDVATIKSDVATIKTDVAAIKSDVATVKSDVTAIKADVESLADVLTVQVAIDTATCANGGVQCTNFSLSEPANDGNNNPVQLIMMVSQGGAPVSGLSVDDFEVLGGIVPPGGTAAILCDSTDCGIFNFDESGAPGLYSMFLVTADISIWDTGRYASSLTVTDPAGGSGTALVSFDIPPAPAP